MAEPCRCPLAEELMHRVSELERRVKELEDENKKLKEEKKTLEIKYHILYALLKYLSKIQRCSVR